MKKLTVPVGTPALGLVMPIVAVSVTGWSGAGAEGEAVNVVVVVSFATSKVSTAEVLVMSSVSPE